jgi:hypothetical protein
MKPLAEWIGRLMEVARGTSGARTALLQPQRAAEQWTGTDRQGEVDGAFSDAAFALERAQVDFDLVHEGALAGDDQLLSRARVRDGALAVGAARYDLVVLPDTFTLDAACVRTLAAFVRAGGTVIAVGDLPADDADGNDRSLARGLSDLFGDAGSSSRRYGAGRAVRVADVSGLRAAAHEAGVAAAVLEPASDAVRVLRVTRGADTAFLLNNESGTAVETTATLPVDGLPELWDPLTGDTGPAPLYRTSKRGIHLPVSLEPYETRIVVVRHGGPPAPHLTSSPLPVLAVQEAGRSLRATVEASAPGVHRLTGTSGGHTYEGTVRVDDPLAPLAVTGDWTLTLERDGATPVTGPLGSWTDHDPLFSGSGTYTTTVSVERAQLDGRRVLLDLGDVRDIAAVTVNGSALEPQLWAPFVTDVTDHLVAGDNRLEVRVANTLSNERNKPLPSGLLGPVTFRFHRRVTTDLKRV